MGLHGQYWPLVGRIAALLAWGLIPLPAAGCDLALVLAIDVSRSVDAEEFALQTVGTAQALNDPTVQTVLLSGGVSLSLLQWSGRNDQTVSLPWTYIQDKKDLEAFALAVANVPRAFQSDTAPGSAIAMASQLHRGNTTDCARNVIDVSGDGIENNGIRTRDARNAAVFQGLTVNGLVVLGKDERLEDFYRYNVIGGPGSFVEIANGYGDYPRAIRDKLLKELPPMLAMDVSQ